MARKKKEPDALMAKLKKAEHTLLAVKIMTELHSGLPKPERIIQQITGEMYRHLDEAKIPKRSELRKKADASVKRARLKAIGWREKLFPSQAEALIISPQEHMAVALEGMSLLRNGRPRTPKKGQEEINVVSGHIDQSPKTAQKTLQEELDLSSAIMALQSGQWLCNDLNQTRIALPKPVCDHQVRSIRQYFGLATGNVEANPVLENEIKKALARQEGLRTGRIRTRSFTHLNIA